MTLKHSLGLVQVPVVALSYHTIHLTFPWFMCSISTLSDLVKPNVRLKGSKSVTHGMPLSSRSQSVSSGNLGRLYHSLSSKNDILDLPPPMSIVGNELGEVYNGFLRSGLCVPGSHALFPRGHVSHDQVDWGMERSTLCCCTCVMIFPHISPLGTWKLLLL